MSVKEVKSVAWQNYIRILLTQTGGKKTVIMRNMFSFMRISSKFFPDIFRGRELMPKHFFMLKSNFARGAGGFRAEEVAIMHTSEVGQVCVKSEKAYRQLGKCIGLIELCGEDYEFYHNRYLAKDSAARKLANGYSNEPQAGRLLSDILKGGAL